MFLLSRCPIWWDTAAPRLEWAKIEVDRELPKIGSLAKAVSASRRIERHSAPRDEIPSGSMSTPENIESCRRCVRVTPNISPPHHSASGHGRPRLDMASHSRGAMASGSCADPLETGVQGMLGARCTRGLACKIVQKNAHEHTGSAEAIRHSLRNGFTAYAVLSPENRALLSPSPHGSWHVGPVGLSAPPQDLTPTAEASGPHGFAVRISAVVLRAVYRSRVLLALRSPYTPTLPRPPHPIPRS